MMSLCCMENGIIQSRKKKFNLKTKKNKIWVVIRIHYSQIIDLIFQFKTIKENTSKWSITQKEKQKQKKYRSKATNPIKKMRDEYSTRRQYWIEEELQSDLRFWVFIQSFWLGSFDKVEKQEGWMLVILQLCLWTFNITLLITKV